jgi:outer membrane protein OmpA-like peptidoglycan-associated protein
MSAHWRPSASQSEERGTVFGGIVSMALLALLIAPAHAEDTVYVGGSGEPSVEVNLDALDDLYNDGDGRQLLHPGEKPVYMRRSTPPKILGRDIIRMPASSAPRTTASSLRAPGAAPARAPAPALAPVPARAPIPAAAPPAARPMVAAKRPTAPAIQAPPLAPLPELPAAPVRRAAPMPPAPLPEIAAAPPTRQPTPAPKAVPAPVRAPAVTPPVVAAATPKSSPTAAIPRRTRPMPSTEERQRLAELATLRDEDLISEDDYARKKAAILSKAPTASDQTRLAKLSTLREEDLISEGDYAAKRAEILGKAPPVPVAVPTQPIDVAPAPVAPPKVVAPAKPKTKVAALPTRPLPAGGAQQLQMNFDAESASVSPSQRDELAQLAGRLENSDTRIQIRAYAGAADEDAGNARRVSLKRALAVRSRLIESGIRSTRIDVRALGVAADNGPADRVDILTVAR